MYVVGAVFGLSNICFPWLVVILAGKFHGQRSLVGYNAWGQRGGHDCGANTDDDDDDDDDDR